LKKTLKILTFIFLIQLPFLLIISCSEKKDDNRKNMISLVYKTSQNEMSKQQAQIIQQQLKEVGIDLKIQSLEWATFYSDIIAGNFSLYSLEWVGVRDPDLYYEVLNSKSIPPDGLNRGRYKNIEMDKLTELGRRTEDIDTRKELYSKVQKLAAEELPCIPLWHKNNIAVMRDYVRDFELYATGDYYSFSKVYCDSKNNLVIGIESEPTILDPRFGQDAASSRILQLITPGLFKTNLKGDIVPCIAENWKIDDDLIYTIKIKKNVLFHSNRELTSNDVRYTIESILDPQSKSPKKASFDIIDKIETPDKYTIRIYLKDINTAFIYNLQIGIVPEDIAIKSGDDFQARPVGAGPFKFLSWKRGQKIVLGRFDYYFEGKPKLEQIIFRLLKENTVRLLELEKGTIDFIQNDLPPDLLSKLEENPKIKIIKGPSTNCSYLGFNMNDPILKDNRIRQAIAYAIDRDIIIKYIFKGDAEKATGLLSPINWAYEPDVKNYELDKTRSLALIENFKKGQTK
jgi:ABC-type transport system substrate-binding protein